MDSREKQGIMPTRDEGVQLVKLPYIKCLTKEIRKLGKKYNLNTVFHSQNTLRSHLTMIKPKTQYDNKNWIYEVLREC